MAGEVTVTINRTYNIDTDKDIDPFAGTNLDESSKNTRRDASETSYNTYKNTVYEYDADEGWEEKTNVTGSGYPATPRSQMETTSTIKILQKKGIGTKINSSSFNAHSNRTDTYKIEPSAYASANVAKGNINHGNLPNTYYGDSYSGDFDTNMQFFTGDQENFRKYVPTTINNIASTEINKSTAGAFDTNMKKLTNSANQMTYRDYLLNDRNEQADTYTDMSITTNNSGITGEEYTGEGDNKTMVFTRNTIIEAGDHFNRGNDTTEVEEKTDPSDPTEKIKTGIDINSSKVLDRSMLFNVFNYDILKDRNVEIE